ncbi:MAG: S41 family peptidase [Candidatus Limnocylindrales bacterium]
MTGPPDPAPPARLEATRRSVGPGPMLAGALILAVVFLAGLLVGRGVGSPTSPPPGPSPVAAIPSPTGALASGPTGAPASDPTVTAPAAVSALPSAAVSAPASAARSTPPSPSLPSDAPAMSRPADFGLFWEALALVQERYVDRDSLTDMEITYGAISGLVDGLGDTGHSVFLTPDEVAAQQDALDGRLTGIGALLGERGGSPVIVSVISGAPAAEAGVRSGDRIIAIDGQRADRLTTEQIVGLVRGEAGTAVTLTVIHPADDEEIDITVVRAVIHVPTVTWAMVPGTDIADIRVIQFSSGAAAAAMTAISEALAAGARAIILDLRSDPGGLVDEAIGLASQFLSQGSVVYQRQDADGVTTPVPARPDGLALELPMVVLVDQGTASSAEIVAGAIADNERGPVIGVPTFGTGTVLNTFELSDGSAVRLGVEHWLTPDGDLIFDNGITPDEEVELPAESIPLEPGDLAALDPAALTASGDSQLLRAVEILTDQH